MKSRKKSKTKKQINFATVNCKRRRLPVLLAITTMRSNSNQKKQSMAILQLALLLLSMTTTSVVDAFLSSLVLPKSATSAAKIGTKQGIGKPSSLLLLFASDSPSIGTTVNISDRYHNNKDRDNSGKYHNNNNNYHHSYKNKQKQNYLFQCVAKYNHIQTQLSSIHSHSLPTGIQQPMLLEQQAKALQISKSALLYIQLKGQKAREELVQMHIGLVYNIVHQFYYATTHNQHNQNYQHNQHYQHSQHNQHNQHSQISNKNSNNSNNGFISKEDLIQEGLIGLTYAIDKYNPKSFTNTQFSTYAHYWIQGRIIRYIKRINTLIHIPEYMIAMINKMELKIKDFRTHHHDDDDVFNFNFDLDNVEQLHQELNIDYSTIQQAFDVRRTMYNTKSNSLLEIEDWMMMKHITKENDMNSGYEEDDGGEELVLQRYQSILGQFISIKEMEALFWRYGLHSNSSNDMNGTQEQLSSTPATLSQRGRDYEAEAEYDIFGPGGILATQTNQKVSSSMLSPSSSLSSSSSSSIQLTDNVPIPTTSVSTTHASSSTSTVSSSAFQSTNNMKFSLTSIPSSSSSYNNNFNNHYKGGRWGEAMSFKEVGAQMRVSAEYGRRLCASALKKLTKAAEEGRLDPAMLF